MDQPFLRAYTQLVIQTCHRRGVHAIGGMSALIPVKGDARANEVGPTRTPAGPSSCSSRAGRGGSV
jgi:hypothetical protein